MMAVAMTVTTTTKEEIKLKPILRVKLSRRLKVYAELRTQLKALELAMDKEKTEIGKIREQVGVTSLTLDGFKVTEVINIRSTLDKKKLVELGVTTAQIEQATVTKPGKPYTKITCPGSGAEGEDE